MNRKGFLLDMFYMFLTLFVVGITLIMIWIAASKIGEGIEASPMDDGAKAVYSTQEDRFAGVWDGIFLTVFIGVAIALMIISYQLRTEPAIFIIAIILIIFLGVIAGYLSNAFGTITEDSSSLFGAAASSFPITSFILNNYLVSVLVVAMLMLVAFFARPNEGYA